MIQKQKPSVLKWTAQLIGNAVAIPSLFVLVINFAYAPWPVSWNPLYDVLFSRTGGPFLYANHISSAFAILAVAFYFVAKDMNRFGFESGHAFQWTMIILSGASIHELLLNLVSYPMFTFMHPSLQGTMLDSLDINLRWFVWLTAILAFGVVFATKRQRVKMFQLGMVLSVVFLVWTAIFLGLLNIDPFTIVEYKAGPAFFSIVPNVFEVSSWVLTAVWWLIP